MQVSRAWLVWYLFSFHGRIGRGGYWAYVLGSVVLLSSLALGGAWVTQALSDKPGTDGLLATPASIAFTLFMVALIVIYLWSGYAVLAKRWHDRGKSGWWSLIGLIPYIGGIWILVECGLLKGTAGANRYGGDPRERSVAAVFD